MTFSYEIGKLSTQLNKVRLYIGDTDENDPLLQNEEIVLVQSTYTSFFRVCAECCRLICTKVSRRVDGKFGNIAEKSSEIYDRYRSLADSFDNKSSSTYPWSGAVLVSDKDGNKEEWDEDVIVKPVFQKGFMDNNS